ncbi:MAG: hypothetical protein LUC43_03940 [Burkholderiales bacterium]|nr:hypothetical protein [Burkholderiales bacterium]
MSAGLISVGLACIVFLLLFWLNRKLLSFNSKDTPSAIAYTEMWCLTLQPGVIVGVIWFLFSYAKTQIPLMLNSGTYLDSCALLFVLFEIIAIYFTKLSKLRKGQLRLKFLFFSMLVSFAGEALILSEAPKLIWPITSHRILNLTLPILAGFGAVNLIFCGLLYLESRKIKG